MRLKTAFVSIVIPAYNEEASIGGTIQEINKVTDKLKGCRFEIIVVNNNSADRTGEIAGKEGARVVLEKRQGYGCAYKRGLSEAKGDIIITGDADGTYPFYDIPRFLNIISKDRYDFISTNRFADLEKKSMPFMNYIGNTVLTLFTNIIYGLGIRDSQSGMVIFNRNYLDKVDLNVLSDGMPLCQELKLYAVSLGMRFIEIPIRYRARIGSAKLKPVSDGIRNLVGLIEFKRRMREKVKC